MRGHIYDENRQVSTIPRASSRWVVHQRRIENREVVQEVGEFAHLRKMNSNLTYGAAWTESPQQLAAARKLHRQAQWRADFVAAENSSGFHAPQEAARILGAAIDLARQSQLAAVRASGATGADVTQPAKRPSLQRGKQPESPEPADAAPPQTQPAADATLDKEDG